MKKTLKLADVLGAKETNLRTIVKRGAGKLLGDSAMAFCDNVLEKVRPLAEVLGMDPEDVECKRVQVSVDEKALPGDDGVDAVQIISTRAMDRDAEIIVPKGIDPSEFNRAPQVLIGHNHGGLPIALGPVMKQSTRDVRSDVTFADTERAQEAKELVKGGFLRTASIGFIPLAIAEKGSQEFAKLAEKFMKFPEFPAIRDVVQRFIHKSLLLEWSYVSVPANPEALTASIAKGELSLSKEWLDDLKLEAGEPEKKVTEQEPKPEEKKPEPKKIEVRRIPQVTVVKEPSRAPQVTVINTADDVEKAVENAIDITIRGAV